MTIRSLPDPRRCSLVAGIALSRRSNPHSLAARKRRTRREETATWMLTSTALVLLMSVPALALFYGGLVRSKNMLSVLMQVFVVFSLVTVLWCIYGYSFAFTEGNAFFGGASRIFLVGIGDAFKGSIGRSAATRSRRRRRSTRSFSSRSRPRLPRSHAA